MSNIAIKVENLSKAYQLGQIGTGTISRDLERWYARISGKEDPFLRIGEANDRSIKGESDIVWSLRDLNFEIEQGDAVGIIGRNGAGKSTLLKILSKVTAPTLGKISGHGRIASLLEVGTGFHPELSGRENIFLNGAILGMRKREIQRKFDEIVDFAGIERYVDTPVKRYSSGMYVRLAFAVAAHLESEILIVDEVLAVGDAEFQKKCLGKMGEISKGEGRTVLFVSHNMASIRALCNSGVVLKDGKLGFIGLTNQAIEFYGNNLDSKNESVKDKLKVISDNIIISEVTFNNLVTSSIELNEENNFVLEIRIAGFSKSNTRLAIECIFYDEHSSPLAFFSPGHYNGSIESFEGNFEIIHDIQFPKELNRTNLSMSLNLTDPGKEYLATSERILSIIHSGFPMKNGHVFEYSNGAGLLFLKDSKDAKKSNY